MAYSNRRRTGSDSCRTSSWRSGSCAARAAAAATPGPSTTASPSRTHMCPTGHRSPSRLDPLITRTCVRIRLLIPLLAVLLLAGCSNPNPTAPGPEGSQLTLAEGMEPTSLSPLAAMYGLATKFYDGLVALTADGTVTP